MSDPVNTTTTTAAAVAVSPEEQLAALLRDMIPASNDSVKPTMHTTHQQSTVYPAPLPSNLMDVILTSPNQCSSPYVGNLDLIDNWSLDHPALPQPTINNTNPTATLDADAAVSLLASAGQSFVPITPPATPLLQSLDYELKDISHLQLQQQQQQQSSPQPSQPHPDLPFLNPRVGRTRALSMSLQPSPAKVNNIRSIRRPSINVIPASYPSTPSSPSLVPQIPQTPPALAPLPPPTALKHDPLVVRGSGRKRATSFTYGSKPAP
ncbi:hypothetical protein HK102_003001, partial [Quaeritorhiza haematococci]